MAPRDTGVGRERAADSVSGGRANPKEKPTGAPGGGGGACASARGASAPRPEAARAQLGPAALWAKLRSQPRAAPDPTLLIITNVPFAERDFIFAENSSEILISSHSTGPNR